jgi:hypothetical protein
MRHTDHGFCAFKCDPETLKRRINVAISHFSEAEKILKTLLDEIDQIQEPQRKKS